MPRSSNKKSSTTSKVASKRKVSIKSSNKKSKSKSDLAQTAQKIEKAIAKDVEFVRDMSTKKLRILGTLVIVGLSTLTSIWNILSGNHGPISNLISVVITFVGAIIILDALNTINKMMKKKRN